jgi:hypothetical protein
MSKYQHKTVTLSSKYLEGKSGLSKHRIGGHTQSALVKNTFFDSKIASVIKSEKSARHVKCSSPNVRASIEKVSAHKQNHKSSAKSVTSSAWAASAGSYSSSDESSSASSSDEETDRFSTSSLGRGRFRKLPKAAAVARRESSTRSVGSVHDKPIATRSSIPYSDYSDNARSSKQTIERQRFSAWSNTITDYSSESCGDDKNSDCSEDEEVAKYPQASLTQSSRAISSSSQQSIKSHLSEAKKVSRAKENLSPVALSMSQRGNQAVSTTETDISMLTTSILFETSEPLMINATKQQQRPSASPDILHYTRHGRPPRSPEVSSTRREHGRGALTPQSKSTQPGSTPSPGSSVTKLKRDLASKKEIIEMLKSQLLSKGVEPVTEVVSYEKAQLNLKGALEILMSGDESAEVEFNKWDEYVRNHPEFKAKEEQDKVDWMAAHELLNGMCHSLVRGIVPADVYQTTLSRLEGDLPPSIAKRVWARKVLWLTRMTPLNISRLHVADLQTKYSVQGLDEVELRAVWYALPERFDNDPSKVKASWKEAILANLRSKKSVSSEAAHSSEECEKFITTLQRHVAYKEQQKSMLGGLWRGPYDPTSEFVDHAVGASHTDTVPSRPAVNKLTPSRSKKLATTTHKVMSTKKFKVGEGLSTIPEGRSSAVEDGGDNSVSGSVGSNRLSPPVVSANKRRNSEPVGGVGIRSVMEEILMKGLLKNRGASK